MLKIETHVDREVRHKFEQFFLSLFIKVNWTFLYFACSHVVFAFVLSFIKNISMVFQVTEHTKHKYITFFNVKS